MTARRESDLPAAPERTYESLLNADPTWAVMEGSRHFEENSAVFSALRRIAERLERLKTPYAIVGGMALFQHGYRRFTEDVDILVRRDDVTKIHEELEGLGYLRPHAQSKDLRDTEHGVHIQFLTTGDYPGDGKPKALAFPDPAAVSIERDGIRYLDLPTLIELKLAAGMTGAGRLKDLADVQELIKLLNLSEEFSDKLNPYVRAEFQKLWKQSR